MSSQNEESRIPQIDLRRALQTRRHVLGRALGGLAAVGGIGAGYEISSSIRDWEDARKAFDQNPYFKHFKVESQQFRRDYLGKITTQYRAEELFNNASWVGGDSLAYGYLQSNPDQSLSPETMVVNSFSPVFLKALVSDGLATQPDVFRGWILVNSAIPDATLQDITGQFADFASTMDEVSQNREFDYPYPTDVTLSAGGNDFLYFLNDRREFIFDPVQLRKYISKRGNSPSLLETEFSDFLQSKFEPQFRNLIKSILQLPQDRQFSLNRIFVYGLPNPERVTLDFWKNLIFGIKSRPDLIIKVIRVLTAQINNSIVRILNELQSSQEAQGVDIRFQDLWDLPLDGLHPTRESYIRLAEDRLVRSTVLAQKGKTTSLLVLSVQGDPSLEVNV